MVARLILALLLAAFALPAMMNGPCHDAPRSSPAPATAALRHGQHPVPRPDDQATAPHVCIGCIPPASLAMQAVAAPVAKTGVPRRIVASRFDPALGTAPALPPPRERA